ncbi:MAG: beta-ribofuranosylaminobenzene 5'-phosphate synthase [Methanobacteriaceae archaeon]|nr:beta-ribofuranosylaminobenzene 5'-phosphate synthase [Methanobacteriaceae archaeon]
MIIKTPSRLHITLIDLNGSQGRVDGGVGLTLEKPSLVLKLKPVERGIELEFSKNRNLSLNRRKDFQSKIESAAVKMMDFLGLDGGFNFKVEKTYPNHAGLGSGTQIALAVGKLLSNYVGHDLSAWKIAQIVGRGGTSGIGVAAFQEGGFVVDGGHRRSEKLEFLPSSASPASPPPVIARYDFPQDWKVLIVVPLFENRISGKKEVNIFQEYCPVPLREVEKLSHLLLMKMMPALVEGDLDAFGDALNIIQNVGFKKIENQLQNPLIGELMESLRLAGAAGAGMSSFGPTVYAITDKRPNELIKAAEDVLGCHEGEIIISKAQNHGAELITE